MNRKNYWGFVYAWQQVRSLWAGDKPHTHLTGTGLPESLGEVEMLDTNGLGEVPLSSLGRRLRFIVWMAWSWFREGKKKYNSWNQRLEMFCWRKTIAFPVLWDGNNDLWSWSHFLWFRFGEIGFTWSVKPGNGSWRRAPHVQLRPGTHPLQGDSRAPRRGRESDCFLIHEPPSPLPQAH